jgi:hypothetical protein
LIELDMVRRMVKRGLALALPLGLLLFLWGGAEYAISGLVGLAMTLANLFLSARIIGGVAENNPKLLMAAAMVAFTLGLGLLVALAFALEALELVNFKVTGLTLIGSHLGLVLWEAARAYPAKPVPADRDAVRS